MPPTADATLDVEDPDSLEEPAQEPTDDPGDEPSLEGEAEPDTDEAAAEADAAGKSDAEGAEPDGPARDEKGRFTSRQEAAAEPGQPIADAPPPAPIPTAQPFAFRVYGREIAPEGATVEGDGRIAFTPEAWKRDILPRLADPGRIQQREQRLLAQIEELRADKGEKEARAEILLARVDEMLKDRAKLVEFVNNFDREAPKLQLEVQNKILQQRLERTTKRQEADGETALSERLTQNARPAIENAVAQILEGVEGVDAREAADEIETLWKDGGAPIFFRVQPNDPSGLDPNEDPIGVDVPRIARLLQRTIEKAKRTAAEKKAAAVKAQNQKALGTTPAANKPPATVPAKGSPVPGGEQKKFKSAAEYNAYMAEKYGQPSSRSG